MTFSRPIFLFHLFFTLIPSFSQAQVAHLDFDKIFEGDIVLLVVEYRNNTASLYSLDTTPLEASFDLLGVDSRVIKDHDSVNLTNVMHWEVALSPKRIGIINIPSLDIRGSVTPQLTLEVLSKDALTEQGEKIYVEVTASPQNPLLGEEINVIVKLIHNRTLLSGLLLEPTVEMAAVYRGGSDNSYQQTINGETFEVLERQLAIFAESTGRLTFPAVEFRGEIENQRHGNVNIKEQRTRRIRRQSLPTDINVQPIPKKSGKYWLPAEDLDVAQVWNNIEGDLRSGDSINRSLTIRAKGLPVAALPNDLFQSSNDDIAVYPGQEQREDSFIDGGVVSQLDQDHVVVLNREGVINISDIQLKWWDVDENREKELVLTGKTLVVSPSIDPELNTNLTRPTDEGNLSDQSTPLNIWIDLAMTWKLLSYLSFLLVSLWLYWRYLRSNPKKNTNNKFHRNLFKQACFSGDAQAARTQIVLWAQEQRPGELILGLYSLESKFNSVEFDQELRRMDASLYALNAKPWQGIQLWQSFKELGKSEHRGTKNQTMRLPDLYSSSINHHSA